MKRCLVYFTFNGVVNYSNGIGTQTKMLLSGLDLHRSLFQKNIGDFDLHIITPESSQFTFGYGDEHQDYAKRILDKLGGKVHFCSFNLESSDFWLPESWERLCLVAACQLDTIIERYDDVTTICIDPPFMQTPLFFEKLSKNKEGKKINHVIVMYSSSYIHDRKNISYKRLAWEYVGISSIRLINNIWFGDVCDFLTKHYVEYYGLQKDKLVPFTSSILVEHSDFSPMSETQILNTLNKNGIPDNKKIIFSFGRADWIKGFDILLDGFAKFQNNDFHLVLLVVPFSQTAPILNEYVELINKLKINCSFFTSFSRDLPKALCQYRKTMMVVCPSRGEPFSNIPLEVALWAQEKGPVVLCSNIDGFLEQIHDGHNGFLFKNGDGKDLARRLTQITKMDTQTLQNIRKKAYKKVVLERDFKTNFEKFMNFFAGLNQ